MSRRIPLPVLEPGGVTRREFLALSTLAAVSAVLASACGGAIEFGPSESGTVGAGGTLVVRPADFPELARVGGIARVDGGQGGPVAVTRTETGYAAFSMSCPHSGTTVRIDGGGFRCPNHGALFAADGSWTGGQRTSGLRVLDAVWDEAAGTLTISGAGSGSGSGDGDDGDDEGEEEGEEESEEESEGDDD